MTIKRARNRLSIMNNKTLNRVLLITAFTSVIFLSITISDYADRLDKQKTHNKEMKEYYRKNLTKFKENSRKEIKRLKDKLENHKHKPCFTVGRASWYGSGSKTASGDRFNPNGLTAAVMDKSLFGKYARVTNVLSNKSVVVKLNDTGNFGRLGRVIDLSKGAFQKIGSLNSGVIKVKVEVL